ncbi:MAG TPA: TonB-dependent receptor [Gemmatimonadaceae bacterium]
MNQRALAFVLLLPWCSVAAQGVTASGIKGRVALGGDDATAQVEIRNDATGFSAKVSTKNGRFLIAGLEPGGPYSLRVTAIGFAPFRDTPIFLMLGELRDYNISLDRAAASIDSIVIHESDRSAARIGGGVGMFIDTTTLERMPTLNRDFYDFARLVPQISTKISLANPGLTGGGIGFRFNNFLINGISDRTLSGNVSNTFGGLRSIPLDAVHEYQVLLSPYDVRFGDFAGALVSAITRSGTNRMSGSAFLFARNDDLARSGISATGYDRLQYGLSVGGPIIKDRAHFFIAAELQRLKSPAPGPYIGQPGNSLPVPIDARDLDRFAAIMNSYGLVAGSGGRVLNSNPLQNFFTRFDAGIPRWRSNASIWVNVAAGSDRSLSRADTFSLTSALATRKSRSATTAVRLETVLNPRGGAHNEIIVAKRYDRQDPEPDVVQPTVRISVPSISGGQAIINSGTQEFLQDAWFRAATISIKDNVVFPFGAKHLATAGAELEAFRLRRGGTGTVFGSWRFFNLDDFSRGIADRYDVKIDFGSGSAPIEGKQVAIFAGDRWDLSSRVTITAGLRGEVLSLESSAPYQQRVDSMFGRRTDVRPRARIEYSPRVGVVWKVSPRNVLRGGTGIFTSRYPLAWIQSSLSSYGIGGTLTCVRSGGGPGTPPLFSSDYRSPPQACAGGSTITQDFHGEVDLVDPDLRMMRVLRSSLSHDLHLASNLVLSNEALATRNLSDFVFVNLNLPDPVATDLYGRVMYSTISAGGVAAPNARTPFVEVIDLRNTSRNRSYQLSSQVRLERQAGLSGSASYTFSRVRDVQSPARVNTTGRVAWSSARVVSGRHDRLALERSANDIPHRVVMQGVYGRRWSGGRSELAFYYIGESGRPFTYTAFGALPGRGDLNGDRAVGNDPVYVPRNASDSTEIRFSGISDSVSADNSPAAQAERIARQARALDTFIERTPCMKSQRGKLLRRNSCREPWSNTTIATIRHNIRAIELQLDAFNVLNLIDADWGLKREARSGLLDHVGQTQGSAATSRPIFRFSSAASVWTVQPVESSFQLQAAVRYRF